MWTHRAKYFRQGHNMCVGLVKFGITPLQHSWAVTGIGIKKVSSEQSKKEKEI